MRILVIACGQDSALLSPSQYNTSCMLCRAGCCRVNTKAKMNLETLHSLYDCIAQMYQSVYKRINF